MEVEKGAGRGESGQGQQCGFSYCNCTFKRDFDLRVHGCCTICQTDRSQIIGNTADENGTTFSD